MLATGCVPFVVIRNGITVSDCTDTWEAKTKKSPANFARDFFERGGDR